MKPNWKDAPKWANWLAMDRSGRWVWFEKEPYYRDGLWCFVDSSYYASSNCYSKRLEDLQNWKESLELK